MATKDTALPAVTSILTTDILAVTVDPGGTPITSKITVANFKTSIFASPTLVTPTIGVATATSINKVAITAPATSATLTIADGKALTVSNILTLAGTDSTVMTFPTTTATIARTDAGQTFTGTQAFGAITASGVITQTSASATAFETGPNGGTNPVLRIVNSTASQADGVSITGLAAGSGVTFTALSSGSNAPINLTPKGTGAVVIPVGLVGTPSLTFGAVGTGLYSTSNNFSIDFAIAGAREYAFQAGNFFILNNSAAVKLGASFDAIISRAGAANLNLGGAAAAAPVAQTLSVQNVVTGTSNTAGANFTIAGSQSTGNLAGGSIIFQTSPLGGSGTSVNALVTALTINASSQLVAADGTAAKPSYAFASLTDYGLAKDASFTGVALVAAGARVNFYNGSVFSFEQTIVRANSTSVIGWSSTSGATAGTFDTALARNAAGVVEINSGTGATLRDLTLRTITNYGNATARATAGMGVVPIYSAPAISATKTGNFTVLSYTPPATAGTYRVNGIITTTSSTNTGTVQFTLDYVDSQGTTHTADVIPLIDAAGVIATTKTGASKEFHATDWMFTINNSATAIALKVVITGSVSYTCSGSIEQIN